MFKRTLDIVLGSILLAVSLPVLGIAALWIKLESGSPVLFRQVRMGKGFRPFQILKLRTMRWSAGGPRYTFGKDLRVTRSGYWLRRFKMDELPQLWNVLCGEMSLVGPRPVIPELTEEFPAEYNELLRTRPGLTDPATIKYCHESEMLAGRQDPMRDFKLVVTPDKLRLSMAYQRRATFWSDLVLLARTFRVVVCGVREDNTLAFQPQPSPGLAERLEPIPQRIGSSRRKTVKPERGALLAMASGEKGRAG